MTLIYLVNTFIFQQTINATANNTNNEDKTKVEKWEEEHTKRLNQRGGIRGHAERPAEWQGRPTGSGCPGRAPGSAGPCTGSLAALPLRTLGSLQTEVHSQNGQ